jgi:poly-gamma-glutamate capsule biosynthesis protein CapA/YwtB (metallophosphatase superfamily)
MDRLRPRRRAHWLWSVAGASALLVAALLVNRNRHVPETIAPLELPAVGPLTIAVTGDSLMARPLVRTRDDPAAAGVFDVISRANLAITNLDETLMTQETARRVRAGGGGKWPFGSEQAARDLRDLGFDVVGVANNHAADYGVEGLTDTSRILRSVGLLAVGTGQDLAQARAPAFAGSGRRKVAIIAATSSSTEEGRATRARMNIRGRPGVNPLRYVAKITADPKTFKSLREALPALQMGPATSATQLTFFGTTVTRGERTSVELTVDSTDAREILEEIKVARTKADVVIVSVHSHEPTSDSDTPADFFRLFAHAAIDSGASLVAGHGPHRLRGIEVYKHGAILYSLGDFTYQSQGIDARAADVYDAGVDLFSLALGTGAEHDAAPATRLDNPQWWQSVVALATFDEGRLTSIRLQPIDLGVDLAAEDRGTPRMAAPSRAAAILDRLGRLSQAYGTRIRVEGQAGLIDVP